ncbi:MAG: adenylate/guanylate cyclase domain-containing protein [Nitrososphaerales archaeon]
MEEEEEKEKAEKEGAAAKANLQKGLADKFIPNDIMNFLLSEASSERIVDAQTYVAETQARVWKALKRGLRFETTLEKSKDFLHSNVNSKLSLVVLYADLVGSTRMSRMLPVDKLATIIQTFTQEMSFAISNFNGYVLKYAGDAVIAYFPAEANYYQACDTAVNCARSMITILQQGINPVLNQYDYPELKIKMGMDVGEHSIIQYGMDERSHLDIVGYSISMASKITALAQPNQMLVSQSIYNGIHPALKKKFSQLSLDPRVWNYTDERTGEIYRLYSFNA